MSSMQQDSSLTDRGGGGKVSEPNPGLGYRGGSKISRKVSDAAIYGFNRPREMEEMKPEKEPLKIDDGSIPPEMMSAMKPLLDLSRQVLWHWKTFPIILPQPITVQTDPNSGTTSMARKKTINIRDLFVEPNFHELEAVATDSKGEPKKLNHAQLESIRRTGEFQVDSVQFSGQKHTWRLSQILQKGADRSTETLYNDMSYALKLLVVTAKDCLVGKCFSVRESVNGWSEGGMNIIDIFFGLPDLETRNLEIRLHEERAKYLVCELTCPLEGSLKQIIVFIRKMILKNITEKGKMEDEKAPMVTFIFQTPQGTEIDLRLCSKEVMSRAKPGLMKIMEKEAQGWFPDFREKIISELKSRNLSNYELEHEANKKISNEYVRRVCSAVLSSEGLNAIGKGIPKLLVEQVKAGVIFQEALENTEQMLSDKQKDEEKSLKENYPIRSKISSWLTRRLAEKKQEHILNNQWAAHTHALNACRKAGLTQHAYFLSRDLSFLQDQEPMLEKELKSNVKLPTHTFEFKTQIWNPRNWIVTQNFQGASEVIPTVVYSGPSKTLSFIRQSPGIDKPVYLLQKETVMHNSTKNPFWRWTNFCYRSWSWTLNFLFFFAVVLPWCSPFSLRALFYLHQFMPDYEVSQVNGSLHKKPSSITHTLASRLRSLWRHISKSRTDFEAKPDRGLLGKSVLRHFNRITNYILKGFFGSIVISLVFPILCIIVSYGSLLLALLGPILVPAFSLLFHLCSAVFFDFETHTPLVALIPSLIWNLIILGIIQPVIALFVAAILCPLTAAVIIAWALARKSLRQAWDSVMYQLVIRKRARVPAGDSFIAKRIGGPGMASNFYYQIKTEQALVALEARMEMDELEAYKDQLCSVITSPLDVYRKFVANTMRPLSLAVNKQAPGPYQQLDREISGLLSSLHEKVDQRMGQLRLLLPETIRKKIKLSERELKLSLSRGAAMVQTFYPEHVIARIKGGESEFWSTRGLRINDWVGLTSQLYSDIFAPDFLTPMQEADTTFHLKVEHWNLTRYLNMVLESDWHDDLDVARAVHTPRGNIHIQSPYLDPSLFNPLATTGTHLASLAQRGRRRWAVLTQNQVNLLPRLCVPLPVPHPAEVSIIIYNRDSEDQISMDACRPIIRELREFPQPMSVEYLSTVKEQDSESCSDSMESRSHTDSVYEMGPDLASLTHSLEHLDRDLNKPVLVQINSRSQSIVESTLSRPLVAQYTVKSETSIARIKSPARGKHGKSEGSMARIASAEDMQIEAETVSIRPGKTASYSTVV